MGHGVSYLISTWLVSLGYMGVTKHVTKPQVTNQESHYFYGPSWPDTTWITWITWIWSPHRWASLSPPTSLQLFVGLVADFVAVPSEFCVFLASTKQVYHKKICLLGGLVISVKVNFMLTWLKNHPLFGRLKGLFSPQKLNIWVCLKIVYP